MDSIAAADASAGVDASADFLAHDLSEGLGAITLFAGALETRLGDGLSPAAARDLAGIRAGVERMHSLITATTMSARGSDAAERQHPVDANVVVRDALANVHARVRRTAAEIVCEPLPWIFGDGPQLTRLFQNLLANSLKFRHPMRPVRIRIGARRDRHRWLFEISDNGIGMAPEIAEAAFSPACEPPEALTYLNRGLGLAICGQIIKAHGGHGRAEPRAGGGTTVSFDLPPAEAPRLGGLTPTPRVWAKQSPARSRAKRSRHVSS